MKRSFRIFAIFAVIVLLAAVLQRAIARPADKPRISFSKSEYSYISPATASALTTLAQMRAVANQQRDSGLDVDALINAANAAGDTTDTDGDGLNDKDEKDCGSSLLLPDPDDDTLFDNLECELGTDPWNPDTDDDGANDGYEVNVLNTSPLLNDTDFDLLLDGDELTWKTDPLYNDTDRDGLWDGRELDPGTNPLYKDTDYDGINDSEDPDSYAAHVEHLILAYDPDKDIDEFVDNLARYTYQCYHRFGR